MVSHRKVITGMSAQHRIDHARSIKANLDSLYEELMALKLAMPAHLIGAAVEALSDEIDRARPRLRLVKGGRA